MVTPTSQEVVLKFIGIINYYHNIWPRRPHTLSPLTKLKSINRTFKWEKAEQDAFEKIKQIVARNTLLNYPYFNETFKIHTNASAFQ